MTECLAMMSAVSIAGLFKHGSPDQITASGKISQRGLPEERVRPDKNVLPLVRLLLERLAHHGQACPFVELPPSIGLLPTVPRWPNDGTAEVVRLE